MKKILFIALFFGMAQFALRAQTKLFPVIKGYGEVSDVPFAVEKPDPKLDYKIVAEMGDKIENKSEVSESLDAAARMYNVHVYGGVPQKNLHVAVVIFAGSTPAVLNNEEYVKRFKVDNPNIKLIDEMKKTGVKIFVCAQSLMRLGIDPATVNPDVTIATSRFTAVSTLQMKGYAFFKL